MSNATKQWWVLETEQGKWASYDMRRGPWVTSSPGLRYQWDTDAEAEAQRGLYEAELGIALKVVRKDTP